MMTYNIGFGFEDGRPFVTTCRGRVEFGTCDDASAFTDARVAARLSAEAAVWRSFQKDVDRFGGKLYIDDIPF